MYLASKAVIIAGMVGFQCVSIDHMPSSTEKSWYSAVIDFDIPTT